MIILSQLLEKFEYYLDNDSKFKLFERNSIDPCTFFALIIDDIARIANIDNQRRLLGLHKLFSLLPKYENKRDKKLLQILTLISRIVSQKYEYKNLNRNYIVSNYGTQGHYSCLRNLNEEGMSYRFMVCKINSDLSLDEVFFFVTIIMNVLSNEHSYFEFLTLDQNDLTMDYRPHLINDLIDGNCCFLLSFLSACNPRGFFEYAKLKMRKSITNDITFNNKTKELLDSMRLLEFVNFNEPDNPNPASILQSCLSFLFDFFQVCHEPKLQQMAIVNFSRALQHYVAEHGDQFVETQICLPNVSQSLKMIIQFVTQHLPKKRDGKLDFSQNVVFARALSTMVALDFKNLDAKQKVFVLSLIDGFELGADNQESLVCCDSYLLMTAFVVMLPNQKKLKDFCNAQQKKWYDLLQFDKNGNGFDYENLIPVNKEPVFLRANLEILDQLRTFNFFFQTSINASIFLKNFNEVTDRSAQVPLETLLVFSSGLRMCSNTTPRDSKKFEEIVKYYLNSARQLALSYISPLAKLLTQERKYDFESYVKTVPRFVELKNEEISKLPNVHVFDNEAYQLKLVTPKYIAKQILIHMLTIVVTADDIFVTGPEDVLLIYMVEALVAGIEQNDDEQNTDDSSEFLVMSGGFIDTSFSLLYTSKRCLSVLAKWNRKPRNSSFADCMFGTYRDATLPAQVLCQIDPANENFCTVIDCIFNYLNMLATEIRRKYPFDCKVTLSEEEKRMLKLQMRRFDFCFLYMSCASSTDAIELSLNVYEIVHSQIDYCFQLTKHKPKTSLSGVSDLFTKGVPISSVILYRHKFFAYLATVEPDDVLKEMFLHLYDRIKSFDSVSTNGMSQMIAVLSGVLYNDEVLKPKISHFMTNLAKELCLLPMEGRLLRENIASQLHANCLIEYSECIWRFIQSTEQNNRMKPAVCLTIMNLFNTIYCKSNEYDVFLMSPVLEHLFELSISYVLHDHSIMPSTKAGSSHSSLSLNSSSSFFPSFLNPQQTKLMLNFAYHCSQIFESSPLRMSYSLTLKNKTFFSLLSWIEMCTVELQGFYNFQIRNSQGSQESPEEDDPKTPSSPRSPKEFGSPIQSTTFNNNSAFGEPTLNSSNSANYGSNSLNANLNKRSYLKILEELFNTLRVITKQLYIVSQNESYASEFKKYKIEVVNRILSIGDTLWESDKFEVSEKVENSFVHSMANIMQANYDITWRSLIRFGYSYSFKKRVVMLKIMYHILKSRPFNVDESKAKKDRALNEFEELLRDNMDISMALVQSCTSANVDLLAIGLEKLFHESTREHEFLSLILKYEVETAQNAQSTLRQNSFGSKLTNLYARRKESKQFLKAVLDPLKKPLEFTDQVKELRLSNDSSDESSLECSSSDASVKTQTQQSNAVADSTTVLDLLTKIISNLEVHVSILPEQIIFICQKLYEFSLERFGSEVEAQIVVNSFFMLRFICPAIVNGEVNSSGFSGGKRDLLVARALSSIINGLSGWKWQEFSSHEEEVKLLGLRVRNFFQKIVTPSEATRPPSIWDSSSSQDDNTIKKFSYFDNNSHIFFLHSYFFINFYSIINSFLHPKIEYEPKSIAEKYDLFFKIDECLITFGSPRYTKDLKIPQVLQTEFDQHTKTYDFMSNYIMQHADEQEPDCIVLSRTNDKEALPLVIFSYYHFQKQKTPPETVLFFTLKKLLQVRGTKYLFVVDATGYRTTTQAFPIDFVHSIVTEQIIQGLKKIVYVNPNRWLFKEALARSTKGIEAFLLGHLRDLEFVSIFDKPDLPFVWGLSDFTKTVATELTQGYSFDQVYMQGASDQLFYQGQLKLTSEFLIFASSQKTWVNVRGKTYTIKFFEVIRLNYSSIYLTSGSGFFVQDLVSGNKTLYKSARDREEIMRLFFCNKGNYNNKEVMNSSVNQGTTKEMVYDDLETYFGDVVNLLLSGSLSKDEAIRVWSLKVIGALGRNKSTSFNNASGDTVFSPFIFPNCGDSITDRGSAFYESGNPIGDFSTVAPNNIKLALHLSTQISITNPGLCATMLTGFLHVFNSLKSEAYPGFVLYIKPWVKLLHDQVYMNDSIQGPESTSSIIQEFVRASCDKLWETSKAFHWFIWPSLLNQKGITHLVIDAMIQKSMELEALKDSCDDLVGVLAEHSNSESCNCIVQRSLQYVKENMQDSNLYFQNTEPYVLLKCCLYAFQAKRSFCLKMFPELLMIQVLLLSRGELHVKKTCYNLAVQTFQTIVAPLAKESNGWGQTIVDYISSDTVKLLYGLFGKNQYSIKDMIGFVIRFQKYSENMIEFVNDFPDPDISQRWHKRIYELVTEFIFVLQTGPLKTKCYILLGVLSSKNGLSKDILAKILRSNWTVFAKIVDSNEFAPRGQSKHDAFERRSSSVSTNNTKLLSSFNTLNEDFASSFRDFSTGSVIPNNIAGEVTSFEPAGDFRKDSVESYETITVNQSLPKFSENSSFILYTIGLCANGRDPDFSFLYALLWLVFCFTTVDDALMYYFALQAGKSILKAVEPQSSSNSSVNVFEARKKLGSKLTTFLHNAGLDISYESYDLFIISTIIKGLKHSFLKNECISIMKSSLKVRKILKKDEAPSNLASYILFLFIFTGNDLHDILRTEIGFEEHELNFVDESSYDIGIPLYCFEYLCQDSDHLLAFLMLTSNYVKTSSTTVTIEEMTRTLKIYKLISSFNKIMFVKFYKCFKSVADLIFENPQNDLQSYKLVLDTYTDCSGLKMDEGVDFIKEALKRLKMEGLEQDGRKVNDQKGYFRVQTILLSEIVKELITQT